MSERIQRFKLCDLRFHPYLIRVVERLPEDVRNTVLNDLSFQILTDDELSEELVLRYEFGTPVKTLVYLNTKILDETDHQIIHTIASEIAYYILKKEGTRLWERKIDNLLKKWGFNDGDKAIRYERTAIESNS